VNSVMSSYSIIESISIYTRKFDLKKPYVLSFDTINSIDSIQLEIVLKNGTSRIAEVVPLPGYSVETKESILNYLKPVLEKCKGRLLSEVRNQVHFDISKNSFACSVLLTCIDLFDFSYELTGKEHIDFVVPCSSESPEEIAQMIKRTKPGQGNTFKIKLSGNINTDVTCLERLEKMDLSCVFIRFDANQGFTYENARIFYQRVSTMKDISCIHYVEQPLGNEAWEEHALLVRDFPAVATMLDESIVTIQDVRKAIAIRVPFVKFKLFKQGGIKELIELIDTSFENGLKVVLGNGVATEMSNDIENSIYLRYKNKLFGASEANGFQKIYNL
jgi:L-alanine-DL-glutamate epimerase-like enolase superfamily enzyme